MPNVINSFDPKQTLNPLIWNNADNDNFASITLLPAIHLKLIRIANLFIHSIKLKDLHIKDLIFTGSLANYNWSEFSDIDLHVVVDKSKIDVDTEILDDYFNIKKEAFNSKHDIKIKSFDVELYIQDSEEEHTAQGVYSIVFDKWLREPSKDHKNIDKAAIKLKVKDFITKINAIKDMVASEENPKDIIDAIQTLKDKIKKYRKSGLSSNGEYSDENLVFKYLRRTNYLENLSDYKIETINRMFSLQEIQ